MTDFIEYVVAELKSKRLSKADAVALVRQFSLRSSGGAKPTVIHPLLQTNTSDLGEQRYRSTFTGGEFFLTDHQVKAGSGASQKVLPGVAYLEMARAALKQAAPAGSAPQHWELRNTVWAQPIIVDTAREISIALIANDDGSVAYEIYSESAEGQVVHCQGRAVATPAPEPVTHNLEQMEAQMERGDLEPGSVYAAFAGMGLHYGPAFQGITSIHRGNGQVLASLRLPQVVEETSAQYVLHPSLLDSAMQAAVGLFGNLSDISREPRLPFALESLRIATPCTPEMVAWVRYAPGSQAGAPVEKLDIDLCDEQGNVCVQMLGVSTRLLLPSDQVLVRPPPAAEQTVVATVLDANDLSDQTQDYLRKQLSGLLKLPAHEIDPRAALEKYGIDSILALKLTNQLEKTFGSLSKTLFFEYQTIRELTEYFVAQYSPQLTTLFGAAVSSSVPIPAPTIDSPTSSRRSNRRRSAATRPAEELDSIAIIGLSGRYPEAIDVAAYWRNLSEGKDCIIEVPKERWDWHEYFSDDRTKSGQHYSKWGGFIEGVDEFDPLFFNISPLEAELIDPQERLFLQHAWMAMEDAGYTRAGLQVPEDQDLPGQVGVYAGVMYSEYQLLAAESSLRGKRLGLAGSAASIANRVSYALNLHGPSMTLDTMCSSSLTAIHLACQDLKQGRTSLAIAGGVNVTIHPNKYLALSAGQFISSDGHCQSFGEGGDGYIPGEGVGTVVLKRLRDAERDGDHIYGVIRGSALTHGGKTNGNTVPNPQAQTSAIGRALTESHIDPRAISYIEAHGTGTKLGDPIEIAALNNAFHRYTQDTEFCRIGSAKSNIGHCESAAGIAGLTKVLLQMQHRQIAPSLHSAELNPHIDFSSSPFIVNQSLTAWEQPVIDGRALPRVAGISSFGAGGSNAHMIVEEYVASAPPMVAMQPVVILLSAKTPERLQEKARDLLAFVRSQSGAIDLNSVAYTLQVGREAMESRLGFVVTSAEQLAEKLQAYIAGEQGIEDAYQGQVKRNSEALSLFSSDADLQQTLDKWIANRKLAKLLDLWVKGLELDWTKLYGAAPPRRMSLPAYPFARERYWVDVASGDRAAAATAVIHPLLHSNTSDLSEQRYRSTFTGEEFFLADHQVKTDGGASRKVLPGVAYLEMARAAIEQALPAPLDAPVLELRNVVWSQPIVVTRATQITIALSATDNDEIDYEIYSTEGEQELVHGQGRAVWTRASAPATLDLAQLEREMRRGSLAAESVYATAARMGLLYGPSFQGVTAVHRGTGQVLAQLRLPDAVGHTAAEYVLHPSLMDGALQAAVGLIDDTAGLSEEPRLPFALETLRVVSPCTPSMFAWVRHSTGSQAGDAVIQLDVDLCDERGNVCVQMHGFSSRVSVRRVAAAMPANGELLATPVWHAAEAFTGTNIDYTAYHVVLCELPAIEVATLRPLLPGTEWLSLEQTQHDGVTRRYSDHAVACFERVRSILQSKPHGKVLVQIVVADDDEQMLFAGLSGLLKTAALENPKLVGQILVVARDVTPDALAELLMAERRPRVDAMVKVERGVRKVLRWDVQSADATEPAIAFKDTGVYLITGGLGALGIVFAREILARTRDARVVLTGRSELTAEKTALVDGLSTEAGQVTYRQVDLGDMDQVAGLIAAIREQHGRLDGILHSAGMIADHFILRKGAAQFRDVLAPKVTGTFNLDQASHDVALDFFVLFASIAGAMGNPGQADYATANAFMDQFAAYRNRRVTAKQRHGRTRSIDWPLWQAGGMEIGPAGLELMQQTTGMQPMQTATGLRAFYRSLTLPYDQLLVMEGDLAQMRRALLAGPAMPFESEAARPAVAPPDADTLAEKTQSYLRKQFSELLKVPAHRIDADAPLENYGIDSILAMKLTNQLETTFGSLSKTLFFEYQTITALAAFFARAHPAEVRKIVGLAYEAPAAREPDRAPIEQRRPMPVSRSRNRFSGNRSPDRQDIAVIGLAGRYPQAENLQEFWRNLQQGRDCITEIPSERWDHSLYYDPDPNKPGKSYSKWGGFIEDVDKFDPLFFNISPKEAALIDPQERVFLETAWETIEDAGYTRESIAGKRVGVYVGVMWGQYELFGAESLLSRDTAIPNSSHASIANRVSYFFDLHGPSLALDTMCSSSLTAIHLACEELRKGEIEAAIAGGVNLTIHPYKYLSLSQGKFAASDGKCRSFGAGGDGYVPGEGVGAVLLKPLDAALRDGDQVYAVIKSSAVNHGGKTNGYTVPNPNAQADLILDALHKADIDPKTLSYIETHGTGTSLGDPIEITALSKAFAGSAEEKQFCPIGSVKSNIGHLESAAGIAAVTKALLQIRNKQLVPSLHADPLNPNIDFADSPFYVQTELAEWERSEASPRRVGVSSFGAGGSNAHLILEEYADVREVDNTPHTVPFLLSAKDPDALRRYAARVARFLGDASGVSLADIAYTSQVGRTPMDARLVVITTSVDDLRAKLSAWGALPKSEDELEDVFYGNLREAQYDAGNLIDGAAGKIFLESLLTNRELEKIARLWVLGVNVDWSQMYGGAHPRKVTMPTYPFAKERYWVDRETPSRRTIQTTPHVQAPQEKRRTYYSPEWTLKALAATEEARSGGPILLLDVTNQLAHTLRQQPGAAQVILVKPGKTFQEIEPDLYVIDLTREEHFHELVQVLEERAQLPALVLHHLARPCDLADRQQVDEQLDHSVYALLHLSKALMKRKHPVPMKIVSVFSSDGAAASPLGTAVSGFLRTLALENPRFAVKVVDIQSEARAGLILDEVRDPHWTAQEIRYRVAAGGHHQRYVSAFAPRTYAERASSALPLRQHGVYLITGGLGQLGLIFAEYLATNFQAKLILVGRSAPGTAQEARLRQLEGYGAEVLTVQADTGRLEDVERVVRDAKARFGTIDGVIHAAGVNRDAFILRKTREEMAAVLEPKVHGAINLDLATRNESLDLFVLFSSVAGVMGNAGQSDYAYANHFLDAFAESRARSGSGRTLSIDWPLWDEGGMGLSSGDVALLEKQTGTSPMPAQEGLSCWEDLLRSQATQGIALYGVPSKIAAFMTAKNDTTDRPATPVAEAVDPVTLVAEVEAYLKALIGEELQLAPERIGSSDRLESFGIDSVMINRLNVTLETDFGALPKTLLYEHETIRELATFLVREMHAAVVARFGGASPAVDPASASTDVLQEISIAEKSRDAEPIAIIGIHGTYPHSADLNEYWDHLKNGRDLIDLVPAERWDSEALYDADPAAASDGKIYCKWGAFLDDYDKFDPQFFRIPAEEAKVIDPQERLFLQSVWAAIEDAGYTRESLKKRYPKHRSADVGVFVGVTTNSYQLVASGEGSRGDVVRPSSLPWSIANRVSYFFDFAGPSMPIDTACSSSLVAIHLACESLKSGDCQVAIAGGVNLYLHPAKYHALCQKRMLSTAGKCHSYGAGDDGFVPGEGVGTVVLKPLSKAIADRDRIYAVIPGSAYEHSGRSNGYSAPNPNAQASVIGRALAKAAVEPESITYVEGHGTGTQLGDSLEVAALTQAFRGGTARRHFCALGSVKANIGHSESAAGIAGLAKVLLQLEHRQLAPSIHSDDVNPNIEFEESPFYLQHGLSEWKSSPGQPRRALINSFGAGGVNACLVVEEYEDATPQADEPVTGPCVFALSAKNEERLRESASRLLLHLRSEPDVDLARLCYTLQTGREAMQERLAFVVSDVADLIRRLDEWSSGTASANASRGSVGEQSLNDLASLWAASENVDWERLYASPPPRRIALPTYPFARERYWVDVASPEGTVPEERVLPAARLHPLISFNSSTLQEVSFSSSLSETGFYATDHQVNGARIFPGAGFLEMACISGNLVGQQRVRKIQDIVWSHPLRFGDGPRTLRTVLQHVGDRVEYAISSLDDENETVLHSEGRLVINERWAGAAHADADADTRVSIDDLKAQCAAPERGAVYYEKFREHGLQYGPSFQPIQEIYVAESFALSRLKLAEHLHGGFEQFILHPSLIDGALQTVAGLIGNLTSTTPYVPFALDEIDMARPLPEACYALAEFAGPREQSYAGVRKFNIRLLNEGGEVLVTFKNLFVRALANAEARAPGVVSAAR